MRPRLEGIVAIGAAVAAFAWTAALPPGVARASAPIVATPAKRIVSLALSADEMLLELVPPERIVGLTWLIDDPRTTPSAAIAPKGIARVTGDDPEALIALRPDRVIVSRYTGAEPIAALDAAGIAVVDSGAHATLDDVLGAVTSLGDAVGEPARAAAMVAALRARIDAVSAGAARASRRRRVLVWDAGFTYGAGTLQDDMLARAGATNAARALRGPIAITEEAALVLAPDVVIVPTDERDVRLHATDLVGDDAIWRAVPAARAGEVHGVPRAWIGSISQYAVRALEAIAQVLDEGAPRGEEAAR